MPKCLPCFGILTGSICRNMPKNDGKTLLQRFHARYSKNPVTKCWNWTAGKNSHGYGYIWTGPDRKRDTRPAYRVGYELLKGPIKEGMELHHKCENKGCVNPDHLEPLTPKSHRRTQKSVVGENARKTHCMRGHEFNDENTYRNKRGARVCRACAREAMRARRKAVGYPVL